MNHDVELREEFGIGCLMVAEVQYLAVPHQFRPKSRSTRFRSWRAISSALNICGGVSPFSVQILVHMKGGLSHGWTTKTHLGKEGSSQEQP